MIYKNVKCPRCGARELISDDFSSWKNTPPPEIILCFECDEDTCEDCNCTDSIT